MSRDTIAANAQLLERQACSGPGRGKGNPTDDASAPRVAVHVESRLDANRALLDRIEHAIQPRAGLILTDLGKVCPR